MMPRTKLLPALLVALIAAAAPAHAADVDVLPDLAQLAPRDLVVKHVRVDGRKRVHLGFSSTATNIGAGPLTLHGYRRSRDKPTMRVDQLVDRSEGPARLLRDVGRMSYVVHPDHKHWHLLRFEEYEIRSGDSTRLMGQDRKTGFCLGDRILAPGAREVPNFSPVPLQGDTCGLGRPGLLGLFAGISPGWADRYAAHLEGQYIDVTNLPSGQYVLLHWANVLAKIAESDYDNNMSSTRFAWRRSSDPDRLPRVRVLRRCPGSITCPAPGR